jgi:hypothetical protein
MTQSGVVAGSGVLTDWISLGVLASSVPRDVVDEAVEAAGKGARRAGGRLPPHVMVYFVMALALFAGDDYEEVAARLAETLRGWGCWEEDWEVPTSGGITQARQRLGPEPVAGVFSRVAGPVADLDTIGAFLGPWRLMAIDGMEWDVPDTAANRAFFGSRAGPGGPAAFPKIRVVTVSECGSHAAVAAGRGGDLPQDRARYVRAVEYSVPDRDGNGKDERIILVTTITDPLMAPAAELAQAYHQRWEHETGNAQLKTYLRGPGRVLRSQSPAMAEQEIWGYLLTHYAISALTCAAATAAGIDPDRVKFKRTVRVIRRAVGPAFPP